MLRRGLVRRRSEMLIAASAAPSFGYDKPIAGSGEVVQQFAAIGVIDKRPHRHRQFNRLSNAPGLVAAFAVPPALRSVLRIEAKMQQCVVVLAGDQDDVAAAAAIASARAAARHIFFAAKRNTAVAAVAGFHMNPDFVDEHNLLPLWTQKGSRPGGREPAQSRSLERLRRFDRLDADELT